MSRTPGISKAVEGTLGQVSDEGILVVTGITKDRTHKNRIVVTSQSIAVENGKLVTKGASRSETIEIETERVK